MRIFVAKDLLDDLFRDKKIKKLRELRILGQILVEYKWPPEWGMGNFLLGLTVAIYHEFTKETVDGGYVYSKLETLKRDVERITVGDIEELVEYRTREYISSMREFIRLNRILYEIIERQDFGPHVQRKEVMLKVLDTQRDIVSFSLGEMNKAMLLKSVFELGKVVDRWFVRTEKSPSIR